MNKHSFSKTRTHVAVRNMIAAGLFAAAVMPVQAAQFKVGDFDLSVNSTVSAGTSFRVENRDRTLYGSNNVSADGARGQGFSNTGDDGNLSGERRRGIGIGHAATLRLEGWTASATLGNRRCFAKPTNTTTFAGSPAAHRYLVELRRNR